MLGAVPRLRGREGSRRLSIATQLDHRPAEANALDALTRLCRADLEAVNRLIVEHMQSKVPLIPQLAGHIVAAGGKRLRPLLTLAAARMCGHAGTRHLALAATVEFIHTATLLHDDVVDDSDLRRGRDTAKVLWGNEASVLVGDFLFSRAFQLMVRDGDLRVLEILSGAAAVIAEGEVGQLVTTNDIATDEDAYLDVIRGKTAALFAAACQVGAVVAGRPRHEEAALKAFGESLGICFQLIDDTLDYSARQADLGKTIGDDFREGKATLPVVLAVARADDDERAFWRRTIEELDQRDGDLEQAIALMHRHEALEETIARARAYGDTARQALETFPPGAHRDALLDVVEFCIERAY